MVLVGFAWNVDLSILQSHKILTIEQQINRKERIWKNVTESFVNLGKGQNVYTLMLLGIQQEMNRHL
jgi:hypothetical protein